MSDASGPLARQKSIQSLTVQGRYREAFAEGERLLDAGPAGFDMRWFWYPLPDAQIATFAPAHMETLRAFERGRLAPWSVYYQGLLTRGVEGSQVWLGARDLFAGRYAWMNTMIGRVLALQGRWQDALERLELAAAGRDGFFDWRTYACMAEARLCLGQRAEALESLARAQERAPEGPERGEARAWHGELLLWLGEYDAALRELDAAEAAGAPFAPAWRAGALLGLGRMKDGLAALDLFIDGGGWYDPEAFVWRGEARRRAGRRDEALKDLEREPSWFWARLNRALLFAESGDADAMRREAAELPDRVMKRLAERLGLPPAAAWDAKTLERALRSALELAKGFRRDEYEQAVWLNAAPRISEEKPCASRTSSRRSATRR